MNGAIRDFGVLAVHGVKRGDLSVGLVSDKALEVVTCRSVKERCPGVWAPQRQISRTPSRRLSDSRTSSACAAEGRVPPGQPAPGRRSRKNHRKIQPAAQLGSSAPSGHRVIANLANVFDYRATPDPCLLRKNPYRLEG